ncbi:MAG: hypothetical protein ACREP9_18080, partial [Candidatus Dormibacteraceae bacterium]
ILESSALWMKQNLGKARAYHPAVPAVAFAGTRSKLRFGKYAGTNPQGAILFRRMLENLRRG